MSDLIAEIKQIIERIKEKIQAFKDADDLLAKVDAVFGILKEVIKIVEELKEGFAGEDKKELAKAVLLELYKDNINIKFLPDSIEYKAVSFVIDIAIDKMVDYLNDKGWDI